MSSKKPIKKKKKAVDPKLTTRRGIILISVLAVLILVVNLIMASYSWFSPGRTTGSGVKYQDVVKTRSEQCSFETYLGSKTPAYNEENEDTYQQYYSGIRHNTIVYGSDAISAPIGTITPGVTIYLKTEIHNADHNFPSVVSLFMLNMPANVKVCVSNPSNSAREVTSPQSSYDIIRNAYVKVLEDNDVDGPGLLTIEWSVTNIGNSDITDFDVTPVENGDAAGLYLMYN